MYKVLGLEYDGQGLAVWSVTFQPCIFSAASFLLQKRSMR